MPQSPERYARIWAELESQGSMIGPHDLQIAATAIHRGHGIATLNQKEFARVSGLQLVDVARYARKILGEPRAADS